MNLRIALSALSVFCGLSLAQAQPKDIDKLCPPRPETAAKFRKGSYPPAARPYREAGLMAFKYMMSLPDMSCLVETGIPYNYYQHNAYTSKTHASHISSMIFLSKADPSQKEEAMKFAKASAEYMLTQLEPADAPLAFWPPTYGREPLAYNPETDGPYVKFAMLGNEPEAAVKLRPEVMLLYPASVGSAFVAYYQQTGDERFLNAAIGIARTYLRIRHADGSWPLKMILATGEELQTNALVPTRILMLFRQLASATGDKFWKEAEDETFAWIEEHTLKDWNWDGQFEDMEPAEAYKNPTKYNALDVMLYLMERFPEDKARMATCKKILEFCEKRFVCWETPANHPGWPAPSVLEQYSCFTPIDASSAMLITSYLAAYRIFGQNIYLEKARALADTITRVQKPSGRIPTFWDGTATDEGCSVKLYDWLNCMESSAQALLEVAEIHE